MRVKLTWNDPNTQQVRSPTLETPIAFGREFGEMPSAMKKKAVRRMVLASDQVAPFHAIMAEAKGGLAIMNREDDKQTLINGSASKMQRVADGDRLTIGPFEITVEILSAQPSASTIDPFDGMAPTPSAPTNQQSAPAQTVEQARAAAAAAVGGAALGLAANHGTPAGLAYGAGDQAAGNNAAGFFGPDGTCNRKVGFLFKRKCGRTTTQGCRDCQNGQVDPNRDLYRDDYDYYPGYGRYGRGYWGHDYYCNRHRYHYDPHSRDVDFNESDAASFVEEGDRDYEMDLDAS